MIHVGLLIVDVALLKISLGINWEIVILSLQLLFQFIPLLYLIGIKIYEIIVIEISGLKEVIIVETVFFSLVLFTEICLTLYNIINLCLIYQDDDYEKIVSSMKKKDYKKIRDKMAENNQFELDDHIIVILLAVTKAIINKDEGIKNKH